MKTLELISGTRVVPVVVINNAAHAKPLAEAYLAAGINAIEITLRTDAALAALETVAKEVPEILPIAGTVTAATQMQQAIDAGAKLSVSPGLTHALCQAAQDKQHPLLPGVATPSDIIRGLDYGITFFKFFPASLYGGVKALKTFGSVFPQLKFCPTGGVNPDNLDEFLQLQNVACVGGSWLAPRDMIAAEDWAGITELALV